MKTAGHRAASPTWLLLLAACNRETPPVSLTSAPQPTAVDVPASKVEAVGAVDVCVGPGHSCALTGDGRVRCWGANDWGQVSPEDVAQISTPTVVANVPPARRVVCGSESTCAVTSNGEAWCWGRRMGPPTERRPARIPFAEPLRDFVSTSSGGCALSEDGKVRCAWEGLGTFQAMEVPGIDDGVRFRDAEADAAQVCVERTAGAPLCFRPVINTPPKRLASAPPSEPGGPLVFLDRAEVPATSRRSRTHSDFHECKADGGVVRCWGRASSGQLGDRVDRLHPPARAPGLDDAISLAVGEGGACAVRKSGELVCWGRLDDRDPPLPMRSVPTPFRADEVALGNSLLDTARVCARDAATSSWRCLFGAEWLVVPPRFVGRPQPALVDAQGGTWNLDLHGPPTRDFFFSQARIPVTALSRDGYCGVDAGGELVCGHCGACARPRDALTTIKASEPFVDVGSLTYDEEKESAVCGLTSSGQVHCYQVAEAPFGRSEPKPLEVTGLPIDAVEIAASGGRYEPNLTCVRTSAGAVHCFGDHRFGQHHGQAREAVKVAGLPPVVGIGTGGSFACAREAQGPIWCWGSNRDGAAPDGAPLELPDGVVVRL